MTKKERWTDQKAALYQLMQDPSYLPMKKDELKELLLLEDDSELKEALSSLVAERKITKASDGTYSIVLQKREVPVYPYEKINAEPAPVKSGEDKYLT
ncbi:MAG: hypothetical protein ACI4CX_02395, partial [Candidatus Weimeria sp.]